MSRNLIVNGQRKWTPSPEMAIKEEYSDEESRATTNENTIEEIDEENQEDEEDEDEEEEEGSGFSSSPSIPDENINFDLVYTLHSFEATVDGQATVKKGDALTLLDDSNSYWWLIRDLKTSEVGYIPAENIETPFERLARLNKHRNVEITSLEQASYFSQNETKKNINGSRKKVILSTFLNVQLQILITGENEEDIEDEAYEEWDEEMLDDDEEDEEDDILNNDIDYTTTTTDQIVEAHQSEHTNRVTPTITASSPYHHRADSADSAAAIAAVNTRGLDIKSKVLRVYAGNVNVGASYHSVRVTEMTSVDELLSNAMEKFHISQIETKQGHQHHSSCIEYYLTVKTRDGDEITLDPQDKPYAIHESLTAHLTTPMPPLTQFRQLVSTHSDYYINKKKKSSKSSSIADLQFCMHKRIKHVNDKNGQVHIKVSLMTTKTIKVAAEKLNPIRKMTSLRRFGSNRKKTNINNESFELERIDKLIAIPASITIADLTSTALVKFHIIPDIGQPHHYKLVLNVNGENKLLKEEQRLSDVLKAFDDANSSSLSQEKCFLLQQINSLESPSVSAKQLPTISTSKVFPENRQRNYLHYSLPVTTRLDSQTEAVLKRIDAALASYEVTNHQQQQYIKHTNRSFSSSMSVSRNEGGIDIHLPHGLLRSTIISDKHIQYSLMKFPNILVLQNILPAEDNHIKQNDKNLVTVDEMATLVKYGVHYLDTYEAANRPSDNQRSSRLIVGKESDKSLSSLEDLEKELHRIITSHSS